MLDLTKKKKRTFAIGYDYVYIDSNKKIKDFHGLAFPNKERYERQEKIFLETLMKKRNDFNLSHYSIYNHCFDRGGLVYKYTKLKAYYNKLCEYVYFYKRINKKIKIIRKYKNILCF